ncbi:MAG TPA: glycosyltransferase family 1 protein [Polyangiaceae bacterium]
MSCSALQFDDVDASPISELVNETVTTEASLHYNPAMHVYINGRFLTQRRTGVQRYAYETLMALDALLAESSSQNRFTFVLVAPASASSPPLRCIRFQRVGPFGGHWWEQLTLPRVARDGILLNFGATGPLLKTHQVVTMHDAAVFTQPASFSPAFRYFYRMALPLLAKRARYVVTVSEFSKRELVTHLGNSLTKARVFGEGWQHVTRVPAERRVLEEHRLNPRGYVLAVGSLAPHKNLPAFARAARLVGPEIAMDWVIAGAADALVFRKGATVTGDRLKCIGYVSDGQLRALYEHAFAFVHPSSYEGFGIPPLEAMALGCPVISSSAAALPEVCGKAALYFEPHDAEALAGHVRNLCTAPELREQLIRLGFERITHHGWSFTAESFVRLLEEASRLYAQATTTSQLSDFQALL